MPVIEADSHTVSARVSPAPLRGPDDPWRLHVLAHPHGPRVLQARIIAPDELPVAVLAVAEGGGDGPRRAWRETVDAAPWRSKVRWLYRALAVVILCALVLIQIGIPLLILSGIVWFIVTVLRWLLT